MATKPKVPRRKPKEDVPRYAPPIYDPYAPRGGYPYPTLPWNPLQDVYVPGGPGVLPGQWTGGWAPLTEGIGQPPAHVPVPTESPGFGPLMGAPPNVPSAAGSAGQGIPPTPSVPGPGVGAGRPATGGGREGPWNPFLAMAASNILPPSLRAPFLAMLEYGWGEQVPDPYWDIALGPEGQRLPGGGAPAGSVGSAGGGRAGGASGAGGGRRPGGPPEDVDPRWWAEFTKQPIGRDHREWWEAFKKEHGGENPVEFYDRQETPWGTGQGLSEALGDLEWSQGFERMYGRPPSDDDWRAWWFQKFGLHEPGKEPKRSGGGKKSRPRYLPKDMVPFTGATTPAEPRPPLWIPPNLIWR